MAPTGMMRRLGMSCTVRLPRGADRSASARPSSASSYPRLEKRARLIVPALRALLVLALATDVHAARDEAKVGGSAAAGKPLAAGKTSPAPAQAAGTRAAAMAVGLPLPAPVAEMREAILAAVHSGRIEELLTPLQWNELKPDLADAAVDDPVEFWKSVSGDGEGREILAVLARILELPHAREPLGRDVENNAVYVWPYLAAADLDKLTPAEEVDLYRLMPPADAKTMRAARKWTWWRLSIGADGTWLSFRRSS